MVGFEPTPPYGEGILSPSCLPFHHTSILPLHVIHFLLLLQSQHFRHKNVPRCHFLYTFLRLLLNNPMLNFHFKYNPKPFRTNWFYFANFYLNNMFHSTPNRNRTCISALGELRTIPLYYGGNFLGAGRGSNPQPADPQSAALPIELPVPYTYCFMFSICLFIFSMTSFQEIGL